MSVGAMIPRKMCEHRGRGPNERGCYDFLHGHGFTCERETECRGSGGAVISATSRPAWVCAGVRLKHTHRSARRHVTHVFCAIVVFFSVRTGGERVLGIPAARLIRKWSWLSGLTGTARHALREGVDQNCLAT